MKQSLSRRTVLRGTATIGAVAAIGTQPATADTDAGDIKWVTETSGRIGGSPTVVDDTLYYSVQWDSIRTIDTETGSESTLVDQPSRNGATVVDEVLFNRISSGGTTESITAFDADTGDEYWSFEPEDGSIRSAATVVDGTVFVPNRLPRGPNTPEENEDREGKLYALDAETGDELWEQTVEGTPNDAPAVADGMLHVGTLEGFVYGIDADSGDINWEFEADGIINSLTPVADGIVYAATSDDETVYALDAESGSVVWETEIETDDGLNGNITVGAGHVFVMKDVSILTDDEPEVVAVDAESGAEAWRVDMEGNRGTVTTVDSTVYICHEEGVVQAVNADTGNEEWRLDVDADVDTVRESVVVDGVLFAPFYHITDEEVFLYAIETDESGSSDDARVVNGILNHHGEWDHAGQEIDPETTDDEDDGEEDEPDEGEESEEDEDDDGEDDEPDDGEDDEPDDGEDDEPDEGEEGEEDDGEENENGEESEGSESDDDEEDQEDDEEDSIIDIIIDIFT